MLYERRLGVVSFMFINITVEELTSVEIDFVNVFLIIAVVNNYKIRLKEIMSIERIQKMDLRGLQETLF